MAVALEFIDFIVPVKVVRDKYPGGWDGFLRDYESCLGRRVWYDDHLVRDGAMNPRDIQILVEEWLDMGFEPFEDVNGEKRWKDCCVLEAMFGGPTLPYDWIEWDPKGFAYMKDTEPGAIVGRADKLD